MTAGRMEHLGLRERKRIRTMAAIQQAAFRLFAEHGFDATTVEQIAAAADISPATFFRYFRSKDEVVRTDEYDPLLLETLRNRPPDEDPVTALRATIRTLLPLLEDVEQLRERVRLLSGSSRLRAQMWDGLRANTETLAEVLAARIGRGPRDLEVRTSAAAMMGALFEAVLTWAEPGNGDDLGELVDRALGQVAALGT